MHYSCTHMTTVGVKGLTSCTIAEVQRSTQSRVFSCYFFLRSTTLWEEDKPFIITHITWLACIERWRILTLSYVRLSSRLQCVYVDSHCSVQSTHTDRQWMLMSHIPSLAPLTIPPSVPLRSFVLHGLVWSYRMKRRKLCSTQYSYIK